jgi:hypothetical protein
MPARQTIPLLVLSALISLPAGIASADVYVDTGDSKIRVGQESGVSVKTTPARRSIFPLRLPNSRVWIPNRRTPLPTWKYPQSKKYPTTRSNSNCISRSVTRQSTHSNNSGTAVNRTYSSQTSTTCQ